MDSKQKTINEIIITKKELLHEISVNKEKYRKLKKTDDMLDVANTVLGACSIAFIITGLGIHPLLIASACTSGASFVLSQVQNKYNMKARYGHMRSLFLEYTSIVEEINIVLVKNNMSAEEYSLFLESINSKIGLVRDNLLF